MKKTCCKCKQEIPLDCFGNLKSSKDGHRYDCNECRKQYRAGKSDNIRQKNHAYYAANKEAILEKNKQYRDNNHDAIQMQRMEYRSREEVKEHVRQKNREYLPVKKQKIKARRSTDLNFKMSEILRSKIHKMLRNQKTSYANMIGCDLEFLKAWLEFRFDETMTWDNFGSHWQIDHILPIHGFDFTQDLDKKVCFHWTNLQPLSANENRKKSDTFIPHHFYNNIVNVNRFNKKHTQYLGYQVVSESLQWLRMELRYGNNPPYEGLLLKEAPEVGNPQPSLYVRHDKDTR